MESRSSDVVAGISQWSSIFTLVVFALTSEYRPFSIFRLLEVEPRFFLTPDAAVIFPTKIPFPCFELSPLARFLAEKELIKPRKSSCRRSYLRVDFTTVPLFAVLLLLATKCIDGGDLRRGIVGEGGVRPLSIMALFISLVSNVFLWSLWRSRGSSDGQAYLTISLDAAGLFRFLAFSVAKRGGSSGKRLHLYFWIFFLLLAVAVGNVSPRFRSSSRVDLRSGPSCSLRHPVPGVFHQDHRVRTTSC